MKRLHLILCRVLQIPELEIRDQLTPSEVPAWDSFNALLLVSELESAFKIKFTLAEVTGVQCVGDIKKVLQAKGVLLESTKISQS